MGIGCQIRALGVGFREINLIIPLVVGARQLQYIESCRGQWSGIITDCVRALCKDRWFTREKLDNFGQCVGSRQRRCIELGRRQSRARHSGEEWIHSHHQLRR